ncbi:MAG: ATP phosphoribosyltransferase [Roseitalea sp.]|jgi:ATP phosphoribosyltransferase|nr:ATP phosphoribosyltransferase [Roseitalea sp.]MBO6723247.1 ATP phosphoribosyltransferase [Roseitalea sp.]MBO6744421.1 ATP phosphoribosyltransferase [Roseitalea sp.]
MSVVTLAVPSKGRLRETALERLAEAGWDVVPPADARSYRATVSGRDDVEVAFLSASEIAGELGAGRIDAGITGEDLVREGLADSEERLDCAARLGFGHADVVVAVPDAWFDVETMADLGEVAAGFRARHGRRLRIATKYWRLTQRHFSQEHGIQLYRIIESLGATEGAPAAGQADIIVDITSTGSTLRANRLKILSDGVILRSQACLFTANGSAPAPIADLSRRLAANAQKKAAPSH